MEEVCGSELYDAESHTPDLFEVERLDLEYGCELDVHRMVMDARRSVLANMGHIAWWTGSMSNWMRGLTGSVIDKILQMQLPTYEKRGYLISINRDWREVNFPLLIRHEIPFFFVWGLFESRDKRFLRLDPETMRGWLQGDGATLAGLWEDELPMVDSNFDAAARYDRFLQLKIDPYAWLHLPLPVASEISGVIEHWVVDFQHWARRRLADDEKVEDLHEYYNHIVVESKSTQTTRVIFHRFHPKPRREFLYDDDEIMADPTAVPDLSAIRERFKGRCAPSYGQVFDPETGVEQQTTITDKDPADVVARYQHEVLLVAPPSSLGGRLLWNSEPWEDKEFDATAYRRELGQRVTSPYSDHSSERREYDSVDPMAHTVGWVAAMGKDDWSDTPDRYLESRNRRRPSIHVRGGVPDEFEDARSYFSLESSRAGTSRRSASPEPRGRCSYPIRSASPPIFRRRPSRGETLSEIEDRRAGWLNTFADWGRPAMFEASLWRVPMDFVWNPDFLENGYLIINETAEFRLRFQAVVNPAIRFPRHLIEVGMERGIRFIVGVKLADVDRFRPKKNEEDISRTVTKAMVDLRAKGPRLEFSPSLLTIYHEFRSNLGKLGDSPQARALIFRGGAASWVMRAFVGMGLVRRAMKGPSVQVSVHHCGANDSTDDDSIGVFWDDVSEGDYEAVFGYMQGATPDLDRYLFPTDEMFEEYSDHYYGEWNPFCDKTYHQIKADLDSGRGQARTRSEWKKYFQSSNRGTFGPKFIVTREFVEEGVARMKGAFQYKSWNKRRLADIARDLPPQFLVDF
ncbi:hypothetical protein B0H13DRAFT_2333313 [Mycena leptocephala]|nr:hypothetical protein B0H13DRAFT_2333313 [Mycena leptocephala]